MKKKQKETVTLVKGTLTTKEKKKMYDWEQTPSRALEPWHLSSIALIADLLILFMYMFLDVGIAYQIPIGIVTLTIGLILIGV
ncbi:MAG: hypothetical protein RSE96_07290, partial [Niameybacter sp.]